MDIIILLGYKGVVETMIINRDLFPKKSLQCASHFVCVYYLCVLNVTYFK